VARRRPAQRSALAFALVAAAFVLGSPLSCGSPGHPPALPDEGPGGGPTGGSGEGGPGNLVGDGGPVVRTCNLGREGGVCACVDQPLLGDPPNLFFVLDRSGSMKEPWGTSPLTKWATVVEELPEIVVALGPRANFGVAVFPAPSANGCAPGVAIFPGGGQLVRRGDTPAGAAGPAAAGLTLLLSSAPEGVTPPSGGTPTAATLTALAPAIRSIPGKTYVIIATDGGPNCNGGSSCTAEQCTDNIESAPGCPAGGPPNCCDPTIAGGFGCLDSAATVAAVAALAGAGIPVYVIGVPQSEPYAALLDQLAQAGGTARGTEPQYYAASASDPSALLAALKKIAAQVTGTCKLTLGAAPPDPSLVNVILDNAVLPQAGPDGWTLATTDAGGGTQATVTVLGASCQKILDGDVLEVRVVVGCPTFTQ
jgi:hypothetical protein